MGLKGITESVLLAGPTHGKFHGLAAIIQKLTAPDRPTGFREPASEAAEAISEGARLLWKHQRLQLLAAVVGIECLLQTAAEIGSSLSPQRQRCEQRRPAHP